MTAHSAITIAPAPETGAPAPTLRLADHAIGLWHAAEDLGDPVLLESLRPLLMRVARVLAQDIMSADGDGTAQ